MENDTLKLLRECDAGAKTAINCIRDVLDNVSNTELLSVLTKSIKTHEELQIKIGQLIKEFEGDTKDPSKMARMMSKMEMNMKLMKNPEDKTVADIILDGCNMGIKSLCSYINEYSSADERALSLAKKLVKEEEELIDELKSYL